MSTDRYRAPIAGTVEGAISGGPIYEERPRPELRVVRPRADGEVGWRSVSLSRLDRPYARVKIVIERVIGGVLFLVAVPLMLVIGALIRLRMGPGVLYTQERVGRNGSTFRIVKFRTMDTDRRSNDLGFVGSDRRVVHKTRDDPRHTGLGSVLRRTSLDELPQLWNVLRGDMVLVGPRPELTTVVHKHGLEGHPRHRLKPGITGLWQVSEHRNELLHETMDIDLDYIEALSLMTDVRILFRTLLMPFGGTGS
jgi:lipopolysaccharide/colanic/teichoic acid biosynthesis glycosyltransferase